MRICFALIITIGLFSCSSEKKKVFNTSNLESFYIKIPSQKDTIFRTPKGAVIQIKKGTFSEDEELEIKEAYTMKDILLAGLATESNGVPLRTGGMIYINTKNGEAISLQQPITVLLPTNGVEEGMQVFKGEVKEDSINWVPTDTLQPTVNEASLAQGKNIFVNNCASCHAIRRKLTGPALEGFWTRGPWTDPRNIAHWINNPAAFIPTTSYTKKLQAEYGQIMPSFAQLSEMDIASVIEFVRNESQKVITDTFALPFPKADTNYQSERYDGKGCLDTSYVSERDSLALSNEFVSNLLDEDTIASSPLDAEDLQGLRNGFTDPVTTDGAYLFEIQTLGWYNIDAFVNGMPGTTLSELLVKLNGEETRLSVYAFFPQWKSLSVGHETGNGLFTFEKVNGKIPLYLGEDGMVIAFGNRKDKFYYGITHFTVKQSQTINIDVRISSEEELLNAVKSEKIEGINMDVIKQKMVINPCGGVKQDSSAIVL